MRAENFLPGKLQTVQPTFKIDSPKGLHLPLTRYHDTVLRQINNKGFLFEFTLFASCTCPDAITRWQHRQAHICIHISRKYTIMQSPLFPVKIDYTMLNTRKPAERRKQGETASVVCVINPVGSEMEHKWILLWRPHGGAQTNQQGGRSTLSLVCMCVCVPLHELCVVCGPRYDSESAKQPPHGDTVHLNQYHSSQRGAYN